MLLSTVRRSGEFARTPSGSNMALFSAFLDATTLVPVRLADTLLHLAEAGLFRPLWSERVLAEAVAAVNAVRPNLPEGAARRRVDQMDAAFPDAGVRGWEDLEAALTLPDPNDRHVLAAAIRGRADIIVTDNLRDFPADYLRQFDLEIQGVDEFLLNQLDLSPRHTVEAVARLAQATARPPLSARDVLSDLSNCGAPGFARDAATQLWRVIPDERPPSISD